MDIENLDKWARLKGIKVMGTGDFTHPEWLKTLKEKLEPAESGLFKYGSTYFILTSEISCIYSKGGRTRKIHIVVFAPSFETVDKINTKLSWIGNLKSDGRPILGLDAKELVRIVMDADENAKILPAHIWTPWFSLFGANSGFDAIEECFEDLTPNIFALETGLSSDPPMNWRLSKLDNYALVSNSDAHSPSNIGREANVFDTELDYFKITQAIKSKDPSKFLFTIEFFPQEGKYHFDGHRNCNILFSPKQTKESNYVCPNCGKPLTIGVMHRVEKLADRDESFTSPNKIPYKHLIPLQEIIGEAVEMGVKSQTVQKEYQKLVNEFGGEFKVLLDVSREDIGRVASPRIAEGIAKVRQGQVKITPGYDGVYGKINIFGEEGEKGEGQESLF